MKIFQFLFRKKQADSSPPAPERAEKMLNEAKENVVPVPLAPTENRYAAVKEETSITGVYRTVKSAIEEAVEAKREAKEAAQRVSASVGTAGPDKPKP